MAKKYYEQIFKVKGLKDVDFKIVRINPNEYLTIVFAVSVSLMEKDMSVRDKTNQKMLSKVRFNKGGEEWQPIINNDGSSRLPELEEKPFLLVHILNQFRELVVEPAFRE